MEKCISEKTFFSSHSDLHNCSRIECEWNFEFLCGNLCLENDKTCHCGNDKFAYNQASYCCQEPNTSCEKTRDGDIQCQGQKLFRNQTCHGSCRQVPGGGYTMLLCADQEECYLGISACHGKPKCTE